MFSKLEALDYSKHQDLRLGKVNSFDFTANLSAVKLAASELRQAARYYPIVMLDDAPDLPQALLSVEPGKNACIDADGRWKTPYVPAFLRLYPFTLARIEDQEDQFALCIDPEAPHFKSGMGDPMFTADGELADFIKNNILTGLQTYQREIEQTVAAFKLMEEKGLIVDKAFTYRIHQEEKRIGGFKGVDMEKLTELADQDLAQMVRTGTLAMVLEHSYSLDNFRNLIAATQPLPIK